MSIGANTVLRGVALSVFLMLAACARDTVTLLPGADGGSSGTVAVLSEDGESIALINEPYQVGSVRGDAVSTRTASAEEVETNYGDLIRTLPAEPAIYVLYFEEGTTNLMQRSAPEMKKLLADVAERPGAEVQVTGHTDAVGKAADNDILSLQRAARVRDLLIGMGVPPGDVISVGRGERALLIETEDEVEEPRNRRVEVTVR
ncbi:OmpA family protein [Hwanghaeella grinnelliae]|uniref:OmpA family protein n=1 Tax=Hwanghaeella grinnelliae TaxID=2500179 RepID=A0A437QN65_9PROT|nr:OmpA family protein [Hwanghaeella grinnelliae]RVU35976.1 OmpA family protein [Hwanghaeella grinnelliae]